MIIFVNNRVGNIEKKKSEFLKQGLDNYEVYWYH